MNLQTLQIIETRRKLKMTVLRRKSGKWLPQEIDTLCNRLHTEVSQLPSQPEYAILFGHYTKEKTLEALGGGQAYTATQVTGIQSPELPFVPGFA